MTTITLSQPAEPASASTTLPALLQSAWRRCDARWFQLLFLASFLAIGALARDFALTPWQVAWTLLSAIGTQAAGLFTSSDELAAALTTSGDACGERLWRMPMWEEYGSDLKSDVADLRNYTGKPMAESISAAKFLEHFTAAHPVWAHLDIAGMAFADSEFAQTKSATAYGIRLLTEFVEHWTATHSSTD